MAAWYSSGDTVFDLTDFLLTDVKIVSSFFATMNQWLAQLVYVFLQICMHMFVGELPRSTISGPKAMHIKVSWILSNYPPERLCQFLLPESCTWVCSGCLCFESDGLGQATLGKQRYPFLYNIHYLDWVLC